MPTEEHDYTEYGYIPIGITIEIPMEKPKPKNKSKIKYYLFCIRWLWKNREWENTRQKFKAMEKAYKERGGESK